LALKLKLCKIQDDAALVAADVYAHCIRIDGIYLVAHVDALTYHKDYLHRSGRKVQTGEAGGAVLLATAH
jgi:superfamily II DNA/RNA helicase